MEPFRLEETLKITTNLELSSLPLNHVPKCHIESWNGLG